MQLDRIREAVSHVILFIRNRSRVDSKAREAELMRAVLEFGQMKFQLYQTDITIVDATEMAFRFRETTRSITKVLTMLEQHGLAERTALPRLWKLNGTAFQQSCGVSADSSDEGIAGDSRSFVSIKQ
jgi:hypothetical protein